VVRATKTELFPFEVAYKTSDKFILCMCQVTDGGSAYSDFVDLRKFYGINQAHVRGEWYPELFGSTVLEVSAWPTLGTNTTLFDNLCRIRYKLGLALNGNPDNWYGDNPLTSSYDSIADGYHQHTRIPAAIFTINTDESSSDAYIGFGRPGSQYDAYIGWRNSLSRGAVISQIVGSAVTYGAFQASSLYLGQSSPSQLTQAHVTAMPTLTGGTTTDADAYHTHGKLQGPTTGSIVSGYTPGTMRYNSGNAFLFVIGTFKHTGAGDALHLYVGPTSASANNTKVGSHQAASVIGSGSISGIVPQGWYYKFEMPSGTFVSAYEYYNGGTGGTGSGSEGAPSE